MNKILKDIQNKIGIKQGNYDNEKNRLYNMCQMSVLMLNELMDQIEKAELQNEQFVLDFCDKINELSIRF